MAVETKISRQFDNGYVQVDVLTKDAPTQYYKVPRQKADSFSQNIKKQDKSFKIINNTVFGLSLLGGVLLGNVLSKNLESALLKFVIGTTGGIAAAIAGIFMCSKYSEQEHNKMLKSHGAKQIFYNA